MSEDNILKKVIHYRGEPLKFKSSAVLNAIENLYFDAGWQLKVEEPRPTPSQRGSSSKARSEIVMSPSSQTPRSPTQTRSVNRSSQFENSSSKRAKTGSSANSSTAASESRTSTSISRGQKLGSFTCHCLKEMPTRSMESTRHNTPSSVLSGVSLSKLQSYLSQTGRHA